MGKKKLKEEKLNFSLVRLFHYQIVVITSSHWRCLGKTLLKWMDLLNTEKIFGKLLIAARPG